MKNSNHFSQSILGITLEGFQVFDKPTHIPFGKLTFLFGPNSAGKSSIQDAFSIFQQVIYGKNTKVEIEKIRPDLERHWRRTKEFGGDYVPKMSIGIQHCFIPNFEDTSCDFRRYRYEEDYSETASWFSTSQKFESRLIFNKKNLPNKVGLHYEIDYELYSDEKLLIGRVGSGIHVDLEHPYFIFSTLSDEFYRLSLEYKDKINIKNGYLYIPTGVLGFHLGGDELDDPRERLLFPDYRKIFKRERGKKNNEDITQALKIALNELGRIVHMIINHVNSHMPQLVERVDASRQIPTCNDLTFKFERIDGKLVLLEKEGDSERKWGTTTNYIWLAFAFKDDLEEKINHGLHDKELSNILDNINSTLSGSLFIELGYQLGYSYRIILSESNSIALVEGHPLNPEEFGFEINIFLKSVVSGNHYFEDVGSGIGYVLPVLCALNSYIVEFATIQQPELHLHPALQAEMGDVFIEASLAGKQILIETHSEHLLLRILKRIRQTHLQAAIAPELKINADDVCVLYFDPSLNGITIVKRLRISRDGEFMDRWPRGFFPERELELFDE